MDIELSVPNNKQNVVNVIAGVNGCGKTSLLEGLFRYTAYSEMQKAIIPVFEDFYNEQNTYDNELSNLKKMPEEHYWGFLYRYIDKLNSDMKNKTPVFLAPRMIFMPAQYNADYQATQQLNTTYYFSNFIQAKLVLGNAEFYIKEYILAKERESHAPDPVQRTQSAIQSFNAHFEQTPLLTKLHDLDKNQFNRPVFKNTQGDLVTIDQLSDGEKQLYGRVVALMILEPHNSIILIDEPELALHPAWQQAIMSIYSRIGKNNQFIIATHSPQIIAHTLYNNLILLTKKGRKIVAIHRDKPPVALDMNAILFEIMGADMRPKALDKAYQGYRNLVEKQQEDSLEGQDLKQTILACESHHSAFMQEMSMLISLRTL
jgi:predicted ATP-binding protein involved in virulence